MNIADWFGIGSAITKPIDAVGKLYTTDRERLEAQVKLAAQEKEQRIAQLETNRSFVLSNWFNSGWQPLLGWTAGFLVLLYYAPQIIITTYVWGKICIDMHTLAPFPMRPDEILNLVWLLFGFGGYSLIKGKR